MSPDESAEPRTATDPATLSVALQKAVHSGSGDVLKAASSNAGLTEDLALALLKRPDISPEILELLGKNVTVMKSRKVKLALIRHPKTPRYVSLSALRHLFTFDLMQVALSPTVPGDIKIAAEDALIHRLETISPGERLSLARRASGRVAGALLLDPEPRVMRAALENARLTEASIIQALMRPQAHAAFVHAVSDHGKWCLRREVRIALLGNAHTPVHSAIEFARGLPASVVRKLLQRSALSSGVKACVLGELERQSSGNRET